MVLQQRLQQPSKWLSFIAAIVFAFAALFCSVSAADLVPVPEVAYVTDTAKLLTPDQKRALEAKLAAFEEKVGSQIAVIIVPSTNGEPIEDFAHRVGDQWKLGRKNVGDGLLFVIALNDHRVRIDVMRSLEGIIPDVEASRILNQAVLPAFKANNYYQGINQGLDRIFARIEAGGLPAPDQKAKSSGNILYDPDEALWDEPWVAVFFIGFVITMMLRELLGRKSAPIAGLAVGGLAAFIMQSLTAGIVIAILVVIIAMCIPTAVLEAGAKRTARMYKQDRRYRGRGGDGFGGFGGGFGGGLGGGDGGGMGGMGGGAGSGGGGDAAGGGASGGW